MGVATRLAAVKKILAVAGEPSGDHILSLVLQELKQSGLDFEARGLCGEKSGAVGMQSIDLLANVSAQGVWDVAYRPVKWGLLLLRLQILKHQWKPDLILLVDFPGLNKRLLRWWKKSVPVYTIAPPQVWAYRKKDLHDYKDFHVQVLFAKDVPYYQKAGARVVQGHFFSAPLSRWKPLSDEQFGACLLLCPGSRVPTFKRNFPLYMHIAKYWKKQYPMDTIYLLMPPNLKDKERLFLEKTQQKKLPFNLDLVHSVDRVMHFQPKVICFPGSFTLELALERMDVLVVGVVDRLTYWIAKKKLSITSTVLPNLLFERVVYREWILTGSRSLPKKIQLALNDLKNQPLRESGTKNTLTADYQTLGNPRGTEVAKAQIFKMLN